MNKSGAIPPGVALVHLQTLTLTTKPFYHVENKDQKTTDLKEKIILRTTSIANNPFPPSASYRSSQVASNRATVMSNNEEFASRYLQRLTGELAEDIDKIRDSDDFKVDSVPFLVHALQQGSSQFAPSEKDRVLNATQNEAKTTTTNK